MDYPIIMNVNWHYTLAQWLTTHPYMAFNRLNTSLFEKYHKMAFFGELDNKMYNVPALRKTNQRSGLQPTPDHFDHLIFVCPDWCRSYLSVRPSQEICFAK
jgi:hypothetical protein